MIDLKYNKKVVSLFFSINRHFLLANSNIHPIRLFKMEHKFPNYSLSPTYSDNNTRITIRPREKREGNSESAFARVNKKPGLASIYFFYHASGNENPQSSSSEKKILKEQSFKHWTVLKIHNHMRIEPEQANFLT